MAVLPIALFLLSIALVLCIGGVVILFRQKVIVNEQGEVTSIEVPLLGKLKTNYPSLVAIFLGVALAAYVWQRMPVDFVVETMPLVARITLEGASPELRKDVFVGVIPQQYHVLENGVSPNTTRNIALSVAKSADYHAVAYTIVGIDESGRAVRAVEEGRVRIVGDYERGEFAATLRAR